MIDWRHFVASAAVFLVDWRYLTATTSIFLLGAWRYIRRSTTTNRHPHTSSGSLENAWDLKVVRLIGALTKDDQRSRRCLETQRLAREDAKEIQGYLLAPPTQEDTPAAVRPAHTSRHQPTPAARAASRPRRGKPAPQQRNHQHPHSSPKPG